MRPENAFDAHIGLGSNLGDARNNLAQALERLEGLPGVSVVKVSRVCLTEPWGLADQPWFHNQVARLTVTAAADTIAAPVADAVADAVASARRLLEALLDVENAMGRVRGGPRWGPRLIDLDLLDFDGVVLSDERLTLPHPRMRDRAFVLVPLAEVNPDFVFPDGEGISRALAKISFKIRGNVIHQPDTESSHNQRGRHV